MKKFYYFSRQKLKFIEIKNFRKKLLFSFTSAAFVLTLIVFGVYLLVSNLTHSQTDINILRAENNALKEKLIQVSNLYKNLGIELDSLSTRNNDLRIIANLPPISDDERKLGIGGNKIFSDLDFSSLLENEEISTALNIVEVVSRKLEFEKNYYKKISGKLEENKLLFESIPALKPCGGTFAEHGFGMRFHPILHVNRMHDGVDIITDTGTPVYAPGNGTVNFAGNRSGYGLCVVIDHGFGYETLFAHLSGTNVIVGQNVKRGMNIARTGNSGLSIGPHLHYEVHHDGIKLNPENFFFEDLAIFDLNKIK